MLCLALIIVLPTYVWSQDGLLGISSEEVVTVQPTPGDLKEEAVSPTILPVDWYKPLGENDYWQTYFAEWRAWRKKVEEGQQRLEPHKATLASIAKKDKFNRALEQRTDLSDSQKAWYRKRYTIKETIVNSLVRKGRQEIIDEAKGLAVKPIQDGMGQVRRNTATISSNLMNAVFSHSQMSDEEE